MRRDASLFNTKQNQTKHFLFSCEISIWVKDVIISWGYMSENFRPNQKNYDYDLSNLTCYFYGK